MSACSSFEPSRAINNQICRLFMITHVLHETQWSDFLSEGATLLLYTYLITNLFVTCYSLKVWNFEFAAWQNG